MVVASVLAENFEHATKHNCLTTIVARGPLTLHRVKLDLASWSRLTVCPVADCCSCLLALRKRTRWFRHNNNIIVATKLSTGMLFAPSTFLGFYLPPIHMVVVGGREDSHLRVWELPATLKSAVQI